MGKMMLGRLKYKHQSH